jgi:quercetin dioxygenase-like cupin family protein
MAKDAILANVAGVSPCQVMAEQIFILADHDRTGSYEVFVHEAAAGAGPPPHSHPWDEAFFILDGEVEFNFAGRSTKLAAGGFLHVPAEMVHAFRYASPTARILGITSRKGAAAMFTALDRECGAAPDMTKVIAVLTGHHVQIAAGPE